MAELLRQFRAKVARHLAVVLRHGRAGSPASRVAEQREVLAGRKAAYRLEDIEHAELDEVVPASARAELGPGLVLEAPRHHRDVPVAVHDRVFAPVGELRADAEPRFPLDRAHEFVPARRQRRDGQVQHGHLHAARDVDANRVGDHGGISGQHSADGQAVALVRVRHQRAGHGDRQPARVLHLLERARLDVLAVHPAGRACFSRRERAERRVSPGLLLHPAPPPRLDQNTRFLLRMSPSRVGVRIPG